MEQHRQYYSVVQNANRLCRWTTAQSPAPIIAFSCSLPRRAIFIFARASRPKYYNIISPLPPYPYPGTSRSRPLLSECLNFPHTHYYHYCYLLSWSRMGQYSHFLVQRNVENHNDNNNDFTTKVHYCYIIVVPAQAGDRWQFFFHRQIFETVCT